MSPSPPKHTASFNTADQHNLSDPVTGDSSPSRPSKRRKKDDDAPTDLADEADSSLVADQSALDMNDDDQVVARVIQYLEMPKNVQASKDHSNSIHESSQGVQAFAKIAANDWTYYIMSLNVNIGRSSEPIQATTGQSQEEDPSKVVHIDLGPNKQVSRQHALIYFKSTEEEWWLRVKGRNALKVDGVPWKVGDEGPLRSGEVIEIGGMEMMFVLPADISALQIKRDYLERAGIVPPDSQVSPRQARHPLPSAGESHAFQAVSPTSKAAPRNQGPQKALAPAPPDYRRRVTPPLNLPRPPMHRPVHEGLAGPLVMTNNEVDLSLDENQHIKPQFSYAQMITQAIMNTEDQKLNLSGIYQFIMNRYSYYRHQPAGGWQNSIRHNLSLNKSFEKVARSTDEPGKGMKWQIVADAREDMIRNAYRGGRGGHRGTSNPASPSGLNYITQGPKDMAAKEPASSRKRKISPSDSPQPQPHPTLRDSQSTPVRAAQRKPLPDKAEDGTEASPLSTIRKPATMSTLGIVEDTPASPTLGPSYLQEDGASLVTPAPNRVNPRLVPPSTAQRPSQHMPTSSPAPFWRYADISSTPLKPAQYDASPSKTHGNLPSQSSSPPPPARSKSPAGSASPSRTTSRGATVGVEEPPSPAEEEEDRAFDLTKGFQSIGSYHAPVSRGKEVQPVGNGDVPSMAPLSS
ncbi:fork head domain-containing protein [Neurospora crassa]|nr:fork head domain-containing protein [Neurospora crassa]